MCISANFYGIQQRQRAFIQEGIDSGLNRTRSEIEENELRLRASFGAHGHLPVFYRSGGHDIMGSIVNVPSVLHNLCRGLVSAFTLILNPDDTIVSSGKCS